ncbi:MAG: MFS transporter, partial [Stellaceae bacterium]
MSARQWLRLLPVGLGASIVPLDTAVNIGFPDITKSFGLPIEMIQWVVICYVLTYASLLLAFGRVGDIFSHARVFRIGLAWSVAAFLLCAAAPAYSWLLFFRFLQGIGAGLVISVAPALVTGLF